MITPKIIRFNGWGSEHSSPPARQFSFTKGCTYPVVCESVRGGYHSYTIRDNRGQDFCLTRPTPGAIFELVDEGSLSDNAKASKDTPEYTGKSVDYYQVSVKNPTTEGRPQYIAECNDIIEALGMNFAEGNAFKALWRRAAQRTLGKRKAGAKDDGLYDAEKVEFFGARLVAQSKGLSK